MPNGAVRAVDRCEEGVGFEPTGALRLQRFSRPPHSTALPPLRTNKTEALHTIVTLRACPLAAIPAAIWRHRDRPGEVSPSPMPRSGREMNSATALLRSEEHTSELQSLAYLVCR